MDLDDGCATFAFKLSPICIMCKQERQSQSERLFMFGGVRPAMARFEPKLSAMVGHDKLVALKQKYQTDQGRSYICKHCHATVDKTFDRIVKIQKGIAESVRMALSEQSHTERPDASKNLETVLSGTPQRKRKLPPVPERIAQKIYSLTLVKINSKTPVICLQKLELCNANDNKCVSSKRDIYKKIQKTSPASEREMPLHRDEKSENVRSDSLSGLSELKVSQNNGDALEKDSAVSLLVRNNFPSTQALSSDCSEMSSHMREKTQEILMNPLLKVKCPQPINLAEVKNNSVYICGEGNCDWVFSSKFFWENHVKYYHFYGKPHKCLVNDCNQYFKTKSKRDQHYRRHTDERLYVCEQCGKGLKALQDLQHHRMTHSGLKAYQCPKSGCYKSFKYANSLKRHVKFHDGNLPFPCTHPNCTKSFKNAYDLKCHTRLHTGEKPYRCSEAGCGAAFRLPSEFTKHRRAHTGERPFQCSHAGCEATFATSGYLASHVLGKHATTLPFCCDTCGKTLKHKVSYNAHIRLHAAEVHGSLKPSHKPKFSCQQCGKSLKSDQSKHKCKGQSSTKTKPQEGPEILRQNTPLQDHASLGPSAVNEQGVLLPMSLSTEHVVGNPVLFSASNLQSHHSLPTLRESSEFSETSCVGPGLTAHFTPVSESLISQNLPTRVTSAIPNQTQQFVGHQANDTPSKESDLLTATEAHVFLTTGSRESNTAKGLDTQSHLPVTDMRACLNEQSPTSFSRGVTLNCKAQLLSIPQPGAALNSGTKTLSAPEKQVTLHMNRLRAASVLQTSNVIEVLGPSASQFSAPMKCVASDSHIIPPDVRSHPLPQLDANGMMPAVTPLVCVANPDVNALPTSVNENPSTGLLSQSTPLPLLPTGASSVDLGSHQQQSFHQQHQEPSRHQQQQEQQQQQDQHRLPQNKSSLH